MPKYLKNVNLSDKKSQNSDKSHGNVNLSDNKPPQTSVRST